MRRVAVMVVALTFAVVGASCSSSGSDPRANQPPTTTPDPNAQAKADIRKVLEGYYKTYVALLRAPSAHPSGLELYATGTYLQAARAEVAKLAATGHHSTDSPKHAASFSIREITVQGKAATAKTCEFSDQWIVDANGAPLNTESGTYESAFHLVATDGGWRIDRLLSEQLTKGASRCG